MKYAVHIILLIQLFNCNRCKVRIIMWFNCFNSSHQLNDHIFLSRPSITHRTDTNLSLYNFPSLLLSSFTDVIHSGQNSLIFLTLYVFFILCVSSLSSLNFTTQVSGSMSPFVRAVSVSAPIIQLRTSLRACTHTRPGSRAYAYQVWSSAETGGQDRSHCVQSAQAGQ